MSNLQSTQFKHLMSRFVTGVTVLATMDPDRPSTVAGMTANAISAVSLEPLLLLCCVRNTSRFLPKLMPGELFSVNVLSVEQDAVSRHYGGQPSPAGEGQWDFSGLAPTLLGANASFICKSMSWTIAGDHTVIFGEVRDMKSMDPPSPALVFAAGKYSQIELAR